MANSSSAALHWSAYIDAARADQQFGALPTLEVRHARFIRWRRGCVRLFDGLGFNRLAGRALFLGPMSTGSYPHR
jgi:hypothetical protein